MGALNVATATDVRDLDRLEQLYAAELEDSFVDKALRKIIDRQIARDEADLKRANQVLAQFEQQYGLSTDDFWFRFQAGQTADSADFMEWNVFSKMRNRICSRLQILRGGDARG